MGPFAGRPLEFEEWQIEFFGEGMAVDEFDLPYWSTIVKVVPRKNGKTTGTGSIGGYEVDQEEGTPIVGLAATSDDQAGELFDAVGGFIGASDYLSDRFHIRDYDGEIARTDGGGFIRRMRMDWRRLHGKNLSKLLADEIHAWSTPNLRRCWEALTTGDGARPSFQTWCITTEGEPDEIGESILAQLVMDNERHGEIERVGALTISRNHDSRVLIYRYSAEMPAADPQPVREAYARWADARTAETDDADALRGEYEAAAETCIDAVKAANPASWITRQYLLKKALDPKISRSSFLRYHACVATEAEEAWFSPAQWTALIGGSGSRGDLCVGIDGSRSHDTTAVAWANMAEDGKIDLQSRVFSVRKEAPHHEFCAGGKIDYDRVEQFATVELAQFGSVIDIAYDPRYLGRTADVLEAALGIPAVPVEPGSTQMRDALATFHRLVIEGQVRHNGDPILAAHIAATRAIQDERGWTIKKQKHSKPIDAVIAASLAVWRASQASNELIVELW